MNARQMKAVAAVVLLATVCMAQAAITVQTVAVGDVGNLADTRYATPGYGAVSYAYRIGKYEITAGQYTSFLNAVARTDTYELYNTQMDTDVYVYGCNIKRTGSSGNYVYSVAADWANRPVNFVTWGDAARFVNWMNNGQISGAQDLTTTEDGAYYLNGATTNDQLSAVTRKANWKWAIANENEWYKAAYYKGGSTIAGYWDYPTQSDTPPSNVGSDGYTDPSNHANYNTGGAPPAGYTIGDPYHHTIVGEFENSGSAFGTFDQGGNLFEWTETFRETFSGQRRILRGGSYDASLEDMLAENYMSMSSTWDWNDDIGFRLVEIPEPATAAILALGAGLLTKRRLLRASATD